MYQLTVISSSSIYIFYFLWNQLDKGVICHQQVHKTEMQMNYHLAERVQSATGHILLSLTLGRLPDMVLLFQWGGWPLSSSKDALGKKNTFPMRPGVTLSLGSCFPGAHSVTL